VGEAGCKEELTRRPLTDVIFSLKFLSECANSGCRQCGASVLDSWIFLDKLKEEMNALPDMIEI
jgi:hypothetical protein